jgi:glycosyltransferase involved in cell wall biosynthesis
MSCDERATRYWYVVAMRDAVHKVLLFIPHLQQGGAERQILELMRRLPPRYAPLLCVYRDEDDPHYSVDHDRVRALGINDMGARGLARLVKLLRDESPVILHSYRDKANLWSRLAALAAPVPIVLTSVRNRYQGIVFGLAEFLFQRVSDRVITNSRGVQEELVTWSRVKPERVQVIHNFLDLDTFRPPSDAERRFARAQFGFRPDEIIIVLPGRLARQKHQLGLAVALAILRRRGELPANVRFVLAGRRRDRYYSRIVPVAIRALRVADRVTYLEPIKNMVSLYHACDALVMPSLYEGMSNAVLEAHACGLPAVVSRAANRDRIVIDRETGFEVRTFDPRPLADALRDLIALSPAERRAMGECGRAHVATAFHPDRILEEIVALYDRMVQEKGLT